jgi:hypothetical protein
MLISNHEEYLRKSVGLSVSDGKESGSLQSTKMYSYAQCAMQEKSVLQSTWVPAWPTWSRGLAPSTLST